MGPSKRFITHVDTGSELRCPECGKMFGKGEYPANPIEIKCARCKAIITFWRVPQKLDSQGS